MKFVKAQNLAPGMEVDLKITDITGNVIFKPRTRLTDRNIEYILSKGYHGLYIYDGRMEEIRPRFDYIPDDFSVGSNVIKKKDFQGMKRIAFDIADAVERGTMRRVEILNIQPYEDYDYYHAINTAVYSAIIGRKLGISGTDLKLLSLSGVLHDIGMSFIPVGIINKTAPLTEQEYIKIKEHTELGIRLIGDKGVPQVVMEAIRYHHENVNGTGYPAQLAGDRIPVFSKIIHVADVLDAMTTKRPYKEAYYSADAIDYVLGGSGILFDETIVNAVVESFEAYPLGVGVELSDNSKCIVAKHTKNPRRPIVLIDNESRFVNLDSDPEYANVTIKPGRLENQSIQATKDSSQSRVADRLKSIKDDNTGGTRIISNDSVMVVDDSVVNRKIVRSALDSAYKVYEFSSGAECLRYIRTNGVASVIIMDIEMPGLDGVKTVSKIRELGYTDVPVIFLTAINDIQTILKCKKVGAVDYILKPAKPVYIFERTNVAMHKAQKIYDV